MENNSYEKSYVRKRKWKIASAIVLSLSLVVVTTFAIISFIGDKLGNYTVEAKDNTRSLTLDVSKTFNNKSTFLKANSISSIYAITADDMPSVGEIDSSSLQGDHSGRKDVNGDGDYSEDLYFAYTFYVTNVGVSSVNYSVKLKLEEVRRPSNIAVSILEYVRIRVFENTVISGQADTHDVKTYAKAATYPKNNEYREKIVNEDDSDIYQDINKGYADEFYNEDYIINTQNNKTAIDVDEIKRFTVVLWLEGSDPDCIGNEPESAAIRFSMLIEA